MTWGLTEWVQVLEQCFTLDRFWHWLQDWSYVVKRRHLSWSCDDYGVDSFLFSSTADLCLLYQFMALLQSLYSTKTSVNMPYRRAYQVSLWGFLCVFCFCFRCIWFWKLSFDPCVKFVFLIRSLLKFMKFTGHSLGSWGQKVAGEWITRDGPADLLFYTHCCQLFKVCSVVNDIQLNSVGFELKRVREPQIKTQVSLKTLTVSPLFYRFGSPWLGIWNR